MTATIEQIIIDTEEVIGETAGAGVQTYDEDTLLKHVVRSFNMVFKKFYWPHYSKWSRVQLDGTTGKITSATEFAKVLDFEDFAYVKFDGKSTDVPRLPKGANPYAISGSSLRFWTALHVDDASYATKRLQFYSITSAEWVNVYARHYPKGVSDTWTTDDVLYLDKDMLIYGTAFLALNGSDLNPTAAETCKEMMEMRFRDIISSLSTGEIAVSESANIPNDWYALP